MRVVGLFTLVGAVFLLIEATDGTTEETSFGKLKGTECDRICHPGRECKLVHGKETCVCKTQCPDRHKPVCGTDGHLYINHCDLHRTACVSGRKISIDWGNTCREISFTKSKCDLDAVTSLKKKILERFSKELIGTFSTDKYIDMLFRRQDGDDNKQMNRVELAKFLLNYAMYKDVRAQLMKCGVDDWMNYEDMNMDELISREEFYRGYSDPVDAVEATTEPPDHVTPTSRNTEPVSPPMTDKNVEPKVPDTKKSSLKPQKAKVPPTEAHHHHKTKNVFYAFAGDGIYVIDPVTSSIVRHISRDDVIESTESKVCGAHAPGVKHACAWGGTVKVGEDLVYVADSMDRRLIVLDINSQKVIEEISVSGYPVDLQYVWSRDELWILSWGERDLRFVTQDEDDNGTIQVVSRAKEKITHSVSEVTQHPKQHGGAHSVHITDCCHLRDEKRYGYVTHVNEPGIHEIDLETKEYTRFINFSLSGCHGSYGFTYSSVSNYGFVQCFTNKEKSLRAQHLVYLKTGELFAIVPVNTGLPHVSPDGRFIVSLNDYMVTALYIDDDRNVQLGDQIKTSMILSDVAFVVKDDGFDLYVTSKDQSAVVVLHLSPSGLKTLDIMTGLGLPNKGRNWEHTKRNIVIGCEYNDRYLATPATDESAVYIIDGQRRVLSGHVSGIPDVQSILWVNEPEEY